MSTLAWILLIVFLLLLLGVIPVYPHSAQWGYGPSGLVVLLLVILIVLAMTGRI